MTGDSTSCLVFSISWGSVQSIFTYFNNACKSGIALWAMGHREAVQLWGRTRTGLEAVWRALGRAGGGWRRWLRAAAAPSPSVPRTGSCGRRTSSLCAPAWRLWPSPLAAWRDCSRLPRLLGCLVRHSAHIPRPTPPWAVHAAGAEIQLRRPRADASTRYMWLLHPSVDLLAAT